MAAKRQTSSHGGVLASVVALAAGVFALDLFLPRGVAGGTPYVAVVLVSLWLPRPRHVLLTAAAVTALGVIDLFVSPPGGVFWMAVVNRMLSVFAIWVTAVLGLALRKATGAARDQEARMRAVWETAVEGIITIDERGTIESFNPAAERIFGYAAEEVVGRNVRLLMPSPYRDQHDRYLRNYLETGERKIIGVGREVLGRRKNGSSFPLDISVSEVWLGDRRMFTGIVRDISHRKQIEERLVQSERLAAIGQVATSIAHESRNALQRIHANAEMLEIELADKPQALEDLARIGKAADDIQRLLEEIRSYSGTLTLERDACSLAGVWRQAWTHLAPLHSRRQVEFREAADCVDTTCLADSFRLEQVFRNLFENALAACGDPAWIEVRCSQAMLHGSEALEIAIRDNGPGLGEEQRRKVFDAFYSTKAKGTGLGMAIAKRIVEAHEGQIAVGDSQPGAEFVITLPRSPPSVENRPSSTFC